MAPDNNSAFNELPLVPEAVLRQHRVLEKNDTRFRACARLLQALWRETQDLPIGQFEHPNRRPRRIGSLLGNSAAEAGRNFLSPAVAHLTRREVAYQERGAIIDRRRLFTNLLSSQPLCFNLFAPLRLDQALGAKVIRSVIPDIDLARILHVWFEHSPGRRDQAFTDDRTAFDVAIIYERGDGRRCFLGFETKYSETGAEAAPGDLSARYEELAAASGLYLEPSSSALRRPPYQQLFREHLLAFAALQSSEYAEARFIQIAPRLNHQVHEHAKRYAATLANETGGTVPFINLNLEQVIEAVGWAGELDYAYALHDRYVNFWKLEPLIDEALRAQAGTWAIRPPRAVQPLSLLAKAA